MYRGTNARQVRGVAIPGLNLRYNHQRSTFAYLISTAGVQWHVIPRHGPPTKTPPDSRNDPQGLRLSHQSASFRTNEPFFPLTTFEICISAHVCERLQRHYCYFSANICWFPRVDSEDRHADTTQCLEPFVPAAVFRRVMSALRAKLFSGEGERDDDDEGSS